MFLIRLAALYKYRSLGNHSRLFRRCYYQKSLNLSEPSVQRYFDYLLSENKNILKKDVRSPFEMRRLRETKSVVSLLTQRANLEKNLASLKDNHRKEEDDQIKNMIQEEYEMCHKRAKEVDSQLQSVLLEPFLTNSGILLEICAIDGENSALFTKELFQMYSLYANFKNWTLDVASMDESEDGFRRVSILIEGVGALELMNFEMGAHHRIAPDNQVNRISIASVTVMNQPPKIEEKIPSAEFKVDMKEALDADGDSSYVSITHTPTGTSVKCKANKSNVLNKYAAMKELRTLLFHKRQTASSEQRKDWSGLIRSDEIIRTYDFSRDRVMEHRQAADGLDFQGKLSTFMEGGEPLGQLQARLLNHQHYQALTKEIKKFCKKRNIDYEDEDVYTPGSM